MSKESESKMVQREPVCEAAALARAMPKARADIASMCTAVEEGR
jgi:hypothetical protein